MQTGSQQGRKPDCTHQTSTTRLVSEIRCVFEFLLSDPDVTPGLWVQMSALVLTRQISTR